MFNGDQRKRLAGVRGLRHSPSIRSFCYFADVSLRQNERQLGGGHASQFVCFFFVNFTCSWCQNRVDAMWFESRMDLRVRALRSHALDWFHRQTASGHRSCLHQPRYVKGCREFWSWSSSSMYFLSEMQVAIKK